METTTLHDTTQHPLPARRGGTPSAGGKALARGLAVGLTVSLGMLCAGRTARADAEVVKRLLHDKEFKVRLQAAIFLTKLRDPSTLKPLIRCLETDTHYLVRSFCAAALGRLGKVAALPVLKKALHDSHDFVRKRAKSAVELIEVQNGVGAGYPMKHKPRAQMFVLVDTKRGRSNGVPSRVRDFMDTNLRLQLNQLPALEVARSGVSVPDPWLRKRALPALKVDVKVEQVRRRREKARVVVWAKLKVIVTRHPAKAVVVITTTEAESSQAIRTRLHPKDMESLFQYLERQAVLGAVERVIQRIRTVAPS